MRIRGARDDRNPAFGIARQPQRSGCPGDAAANDQNLCLAQSVYFPELVIAAELLTNSQHSLNRMQCSPANLFVDLDLVLNVNKGGECVFQRDLVHVGAANVAQTQHLLLRIGG